MSKTKVFAVDTVQLSIASATGRVRVNAGGTVRTSGWTDPELIDTPRPPDDGNIHLDFVANGPTGPALQVITPIGAERTIQGVAGNVCIMVHAETNEVKECIQGEIGDPP